MILLRNSELSACFREVVLAVSFVAQNSAESCIYWSICLSKQLHDVVAAVLIVKTQKWADNVTEMVLKKLPSRILIAFANNHIY